MIPIADFREALTVQARRRAIGFRILLVCGAVFFISIAELGLIHRRGDPPPSADKYTLIYVLTVAASSPFVIYQWIAYRKSKRDKRLNCPQCKRLLEGPRRTVIAFGNCPFCSTAVLERSTPNETAHAATRIAKTPADFDTAFGAHDRREWIGLGVLVVSWIAFAFVVKWFILVEVDAVPPIEPRIIILRLFAAIIVFLPATILGWRTRRGKRRDDRLNCPQCNELLVASKELLFATGNCPHCGEAILDAVQVVARTLSVEGGPNRLTAAEFRAAIVANRRQLGIMLLLFVASIVVFCFAINEFPLIQKEGDPPVDIGEFAFRVFVGLMIFLPCALYGLLSYVKGERDNRLLCPHCKKMPFQSEQIVIASKNCPHCGGAVLEKNQEDNAKIADD